MRTAVVLTIGNEVVSGDVVNTNAAWIARRLASLGVTVRLAAAVRDEIEDVAAFLRAEAPNADLVFVTGGLGGTPDDLTREAVAAAFGVEAVEQEPLASELRARFAPRGLAEYAARWARLPAGAEPLPNPLGGAPGFTIRNVYVLPGLPPEMEAMFDAIADAFRGTPVAVWRRRYRTTEGEIVGVLEQATGRFPAVAVGSYPRFAEEGPTVEVVLKSTDEAALDEARAWLEEALAGTPAAAGT